MSEMGIKSGGFYTATNPVSNNNAPTIESNIQMIGQNILNTPHGGQP